MKARPGIGTTTHLLSCPSYLIVLLAVCVIPIALGQGQIGGRAPKENPTGITCTPGWSVGPDLPSPGVRFVGVYFPPNGRFYAMGGSNGVGTNFTHPFEYDPTSNTWTIKSATFPDNQVSNMACGVLAVSGTPYIYCVGGSSAATPTTATARVFYYNPVTETITTLSSADNWPGDAAGTILPGGFSVYNNKLYILGGFNIDVASTTQIWQFDPTAAAGAKWTQMVNTPEGVMYAPTCTIGTIGNVIYLAGASDFRGGAVIDTNNSFSFDPTTNTIGSIPAIPRATGETRALSFNGLMLVMGGGRVAPNPSNEVDVFGPGGWTTGSPVPAFMTARRNFAVDTNGTDHIWLVGGYAPTTATASMEIFCSTAPSPTPTPTCTPSAFRVLIAHADTGPPTALQNQILAEPGVTACDLFDAFSGTPTLQQLQQYNIVFAFSNNPWNDALAMGNVLADYEDGGGVVVVGTFAWGNRGGWNLAGRWMTAGYTPYNSTSTTNFSNNTANITNPGHPLMAGVTTLTAFYRNGVTLASGATSVADWTDGPSGVAFKSNNGHTAVGINAYLAGSGGGWSGQFGRVIVNAGRWLLVPCATPSPTPTATATATATATPTPIATPTPTHTPRPTPIPRPRPTAPPRP